MTETAAQPVAAEVDAWLARFEDALTAGRHRGRRRAVHRGQLLARPGRVHVEHQDGRGPRRASRTCSTTTLAHTKPRGWRTTEPPTEADGVTEAWIEFETEVGRGRGHLRLTRRQGVDAADDARTSSRATRSRAGRAAARAPSTAPTPTARPGSSAASARRAELGYTTQPYVVIVGGGQGGIALGARLRQLGVPTIIVERNARPGDSWRKRYKSLCLHDPVWYDHLPVHQVPRELAGLLAEGQDRRLAGDVHAGDGAQLLDLDDREERALRRGGRRVGRRRRARRQAIDAAPEAARDGDRHVRQAERARDPGHGRLPRRAAPLLAAPGPGRLRRQEGRRHRLQQLGARHLRRAVGGTAPTSRWSSAPPRTSCGRTR